MIEVQYLLASFDLWGILLSVIAMGFVYSFRGQDKKGGNILLFMLLTIIMIDLNEGLSYVLRGRPGSTVYVLQQIFVFGIYFFFHLMIIETTLYMGHVTCFRGGSKPGWWSNIIVLICFISMISLILSRIINYSYGFDENNYYYRMSGSYFLTTLPLILCLILLMIRVMMTWSVLSLLEKLSFLLITVIPVASAVLQIFFLGWPISSIGITVALIIFSISYEMDYARRLLRVEKELQDERLKLFQSQIQPHFIYNSLNAIRSLCPDESEAGEAIDHFAGFLRGTVDMISESGLVSARQELNTVENYLYLEKKRFEDKVTIITAIEDTGFEVPAFTIQTLVENAIRHGIRKNKHGIGTLKLSTRYEDGVHVIEVADDGAGFDVEDYHRRREEGNMTEIHVGLYNLEKRLELMCKGRLEIESHIGEGTVARVSIFDEASKAGRKADS